MYALAVFLIIFCFLFALRFVYQYFKKPVIDFLQKILRLIFILTFILLDIFFLLVSVSYARLLSFACAFITSICLWLSFRKRLDFRLAFFLFLSLYLFLFYLLRVDLFEAAVSGLFILTVVISTKTKQNLLYTFLLTGLMLYGYSVFEQMFMAQAIPQVARLTFLLFIASLLFSNLILPSYLSRSGLPFTVWLFVNLFLAISFLNLFHGPRKSEIKQIVSQKGVKAVLLYPEKGKGFQGQVIRFAFESCDGKSLFLGSRYSWGKPFGLLRVSLPDLTIQDSLEDEQAGEMVEQDCTTHRLYFPALRYKNKKTRVLALQEDNLKNVLQEIAPPNSQAIMYVRVDSRYNQGYVMDDSGLFSVFRLSDGKILKQAHYGGGISPVVLPSGDALFLSSGCERKPGFSLTSLLSYGDLCQYHIRSGTFEYMGPGHTNTFLDYDAKTHTAFFLELVNGWVSFVDLSTHRVKRRIYLEPFVWRLVFDPKTRILTVGGYFKGNLYLIDVDKGFVRRKVYVGRRINWMYLSRDGKGVYVATTQGVFFVEFP